MNSLNWLGYVLWHERGMLAFVHTVMPGRGSVWELGSGGQSVMWQKSMIGLTCRPALSSSVKPWRSP